MSLKLIKIEDGLLKGEVLYHSLVQKTEEEKIGLRKRAALKEETKKTNKRIQEENVRRKEEEKEEKRLKRVKRAKAWEARKQGKEEKAEICPFSGHHPV